MAINYRSIFVGAAIAVAGIGFAPGAMAQTSAACKTGTVCASSPQSVVDALMKAGYKAKLTKDGAGDPMIESGADGYNYYVDFYGCKDAKNCTALQFNILFTAKPEYTTEFVNNWNVAQRYGQMSRRDDGGLYISYDLLTAEGLSEPYFVGVLGVWNNTIRALSAFLSDAADSAK